MPVLEFKVVVIGAVAVGKTALTNRLQYSMFDEDYQPTIGAGYCPYRTTHEGHEVELQIWDTAGMERYRSLGPIYYRDAVAAVLVFDQTDKESADSLSKWLTAFKATVKEPAYIAVAANKDDLENKVCDLEGIQRWATDNQFGFFVTSAKTGKGVTELFGTLIQNLVKTRAVETIPPRPKPVMKVAGRDCNC